MQKVPGSLEGQVVRGEGRCGSEVVSALSRTDLVGLAAKLRTEATFHPMGKSSFREGVSKGP